MVRLSNCLPDVIRNNILVVFTHCTDEIKCIYDKAKLTFAPIKSENFFYMENLFFVASPAQLQDASEETIDMFWFEWNRSMKVMGKLISHISGLGEALTEALAEVRKCWTNLLLCFEI